MENTNTTSSAPVTIPTAKERLEQLETKTSNLEKFATGIGTGMNLVDKELTAHKSTMANLAKGLEAASELIAATLTVLGEETKTKVLDFVKEIHAKNLTEKAQSARNAVTDLVTKGQIVETLNVDPNSLIILSEYDKENNKIGTGYVPVWFSEINPEIAAKLIGKGVGEKLEVPDGIVEVVQVFTKVETSPANQTEVA
jgi:hypothetical protein